MGVNPIPYLGAAYLGPAYNAFAVRFRRPEAADQFEWPTIGLKDAAQQDRLATRFSLRGSDRMRRELDQMGNIGPWTPLESQAWNC